MAEQQETNFDRYLDRKLQDPEFRQRLAVADQAIDEELETEEEYQDRVDGDGRTIDDDDLCADCIWLRYNPGGLSVCDARWPRELVTNDSDRVVDCPEFEEVDAPGDNWVTEEG